MKKSLFITSIVMLSIGCLNACGYETNLQHVSQITVDNELESCLDDIQIEEDGYNNLIKESYLDSGEICPIEPFGIDKERTGGCDIIFENGLEICLPESWEGQVLVEPYMRGIRVNTMSGGNLLELSFASKANIGDSVLQLFPWEKLIGIYTDSENEYAIIYKPAMDYPLAFEENKSEFLKLYDDIGEISVLMETMDRVVSYDAEQNTWVKYRNDIRWNRTTENKDKILIVEAVYTDDRFYAEPGVSAEDSELVYYELYISNISEDAFDFSVVKTEKRTGKSVDVVSESTALFNEERTGAECNNEYGCIEFVFDYNELAKLIGIINIKGMDELEGIDFRCNHVPGYGVA